MVPTDERMMLMERMRWLRKKALSKARVGPKSNLRAR